MMTNIQCVLQQISNPNDFFSSWSNVNHFCRFCLTNLNYLCHLLLNNIENIIVKKKIIISALFRLSALCSFTRSLCNKHCPSWKSCCCRGVLKWGIKKTWKRALPPRYLFFFIWTNHLGQVGVLNRKAFVPLLADAQVQWLNWAFFFFSVLSLVLSHEKEEHSGLQKHVDVLAWTKT